MERTYFWIWGIALGLAMTLNMRGLMHLLQLESYQFPGYFRAVRRTLPRSVIPSFALTLFANLAWQVSARYSGILACLLGCAIVLVGGVASLLWQRKQPAKKAFAVTSRIKRLIAVMLVVNTGIALLVQRLLPWPSLSADLPLFSVLLLAFSALLALPVERGIQRWYFRDAQKKLASPEHQGLLRIGITGSFGKTSVKYILGSILSEKFSTLITPESFNTPMGVTRIIREQLQPRHEVFVAEMGARHVGDIREMCELVSPKMGVLTAVGPQHLETFGSLERIAETKYELIEALPEDGTAFFARDGGWCEQLYQQCPLQDKHLSGEGLSIEDLELGAFGARFFLVSDAGEREECETRLLGEHNVRNILLASTVARKLGLTLTEITRGIRKTEPVKNRLEAMRGANGVTILNDGFSANPAGTAAALAVLKEAKGRRIIVTPGMVEMGAQQEAMNRAFAEQMKDSVDTVVLVGKVNAESIQKGLTDSGFGPQEIYLVDTLAESQEVLGRILRAGDTVLFSNDLPESYR